MTLNPVPRSLDQSILSKDQTTKNKKGKSELFLSDFQLQLLYSLDNITITTKYAVVKERIALLNKIPIMKSKQPINFNRRNCCLLKLIQGIWFTNFNHV